MLLYVYEICFSMFMKYDFVCLCNMFFMFMQYVFYVYAICFYMFMKYVFVCL